MKLTFKEFVPGGRRYRERCRLFERTSETPIAWAQQAGGPFVITAEVPGGKLTLELTPNELGAFLRSLPPLAQWG